MKKQRYYPFGYMMINGKLQTKPNEEVLVQKIFAEYLSGKSLKELAKMAVQSGLQYSENTEMWNKNMIARILDDKRYQGNNQYPTIIEHETAVIAESLRKSKATPQSANRYIHKKLVCALCGAPLLRSCKKANYVYWTCKSCKNRFGHISDETLLEQVTAIIQILCQNPQIIEWKPSENKTYSLEVARLTNEIAHIMEQRQLNRESAIQLIFSCAIEKYKASDMGPSDYLSAKMMAFLSNLKECSILTENIFEQLVTKVILNTDCTVRLQLINQKII